MTACPVSPEFLLQLPCLTLTEQEIDNKSILVTLSPSSRATSMKPRNVQDQVNTAFLITCFQTKIGMAIAQYQQQLCLPIV